MAKGAALQCGAVSQGLRKVSVDPVPAFDQIDTKHVPALDQIDTKQGSDGLRN